MLLFVFYCRKVIASYTLKEHQSKKKPRWGPETIECVLVKSEEKFCKLVIQTQFITMNDNIKHPKKYKSLTGDINTDYSEIPQEILLNVEKIELSVYCYTTCLWIEQILV